MTTMETNHQVRTSNTGKHNRIIVLVIGLIFLGYCLLTILPWNPRGYELGLDESWRAALQIVFADKIQFGKDFIYTYGPYGFLDVVLYFPETYGYAFGFRLLIALAVWAGLFKLVRYCFGRRDGSIILLVSILFFFSTYGSDGKFAIYYRNFASGALLLCKPAHESCFSVNYHECFFSQFNQTDISYAVSCIHWLDHH